MSYQLSAISYQLSAVSLQPEKIDMGSLADLDRHGASSG
jgi:hypothetical protein